MLVASVALRMREFVPEEQLMVVRLNVSSELECKFGSLALSWRASELVTRRRLDLK